MNPITYIVENLDDSREFLKTYNNPVILTNKFGTTKYYGILVIDYIFKNLQKEFSQVFKLIVNVGDDHAALLTAMKLNYHDIVYTGSSLEAIRILNLYRQSVQHYLKTN